MLYCKEAKPCVCVCEVTCQQNTVWLHLQWVVWTIPLLLHSGESYQVCHTGFSTQHQQWTDTPRRCKK